ncbi:MAG: peptidoglycan DD-metalloendopeptidase family protein [Elusimicrobium sp.]|jgi:septal ring factor EnvC (AmiA/AmiB activator)|nr:peptidoglycan DD-metalloendopeptidase family protein [Elusimicrobium sp.]
MEKILTVLAVLFLTSLCLAQPSESELDALQNKAKAKEAEIKKYQEEENKISRQLSALEQRQSAAQQTINKIEFDMSLVEQNKITAANKKEALERSLPVWASSLEKEAAEVIADKMSDTPYYYSDALLNDILLNRALEHKSLFAAGLQNENRAAKEKIEVFEQKNRDLQEATNKAEQQRALITKDFQRVKVDLNAAKKKHESAQKELDEINKSAEAMKGILSVAETKRKKAEAKSAAGGKPQSVAEIDVRARSLPHPVSGEIISKFGKEYNSDLNISIFRDGVKIAARPGEAVYSVDEGTVIYSGNFRSYGNVVIVDHGKGFFTIYGYLSRIDVQKGDAVGRRTPIGIVGTDSLQGSMGSGRTALYFEVRKGTTAVDPELWLQ